MPLTNIKSNLISQVKALDPSIDVNPGSNFVDLVVNPVSLVFEQYELSQEAILSYTSLSRPEDYTEAQLDAIAANFLIERTPGAYHTGAITLLFSEPTSLFLPEGTAFTFDGRVYVTAASYRITQSGMNVSQDGSGLYTTAEIPVRSNFRDSSGGLSVNTVLQNDSIVPAPVQIIVTTEVSGGAATEDNTQFFNRLTDTVKTNSLASESVLQSQVKAQDPSIQDVAVIGAGSPFMARDLVSYDPLAPNTVENFQFVSPGETTDTGTKQHIAKVNNFLVEATATDGSADITYPTNPQQWFTEFSASQYRGVYQLVDAFEATQDQYQIISDESFSEEVLRTYTLSDGLTANNKLARTDDIRVDGTSAVLGNTPSNLPNSNIQLRAEELEDWKELLGDAIGSGNQEAISYLRDQIGLKTTLENAANAAPILHKRIGQHTGISIETTITTTDATEMGNMAYITCLRNDNVFMPFDGFGLAYRKQPEFILRLNADAYGGNTDQRNQDIETFRDTFNVDPVAENLIGSNILRDGAGNDQYWLFNAYLVDNNALDEGVVMGTSQVFDSINGINQYLQRAKVWIEPNISYDFKIDIQKTLATTVSYKLTSSETYSQILSKGATFPAYVPAAGAKVTSSNSAIQALNSERGHVGIGVIETKGYEWQVDQFFVRSIVQSFPMHLFSFKVDTAKWPNATSPFTVDYWGLGYDPTVYADNANSGASRTQAAIWNPGTTSWEVVGTHTAILSDLASDKKLSREFSNLSTYMDVDNYIHIAATAANIGPGFENNLDHDLISYYVQLSNPDAGKKNLGNAVDVYCYAPDNIIEGSIEATITGGEITINSPYICEILDVRETLSNESFLEGSYQIFNTKPGDTYSADNEYVIAFDTADNGASVTVVYRYWSGASTTNAFLQDPANRYPAVSMKEKAMPLAVIEVEDLEFSGPLSEEDARRAIVNYTNSLESTSFEKSDLINALYNAGATFVSISMIVTVKQHNTRLAVDKTTITGDRYEQPPTVFSRFYTNPLLLQGVTKV